jgi:hypothetical protein
VQALFFARKDSACSFGGLQKKIAFFQIKNQIKFFI